MPRTIAPFGIHRIRPLPTSWLMVNSFSCLPSTRWSRFFASSTCVQVGVEVLLAEERGAVEPLELLAAGVVLPVGAGDAQQLERADLAGVRDVRPAAQVDELALAVEAERSGTASARRRCARPCSPASGPRTSCAGLGGRPLEALERLGLVDDLLHLRFDAREVLLADRRSASRCRSRSRSRWSGRRRAGRRGRAASRPGP